MVLVESVGISDAIVLNSKLFCIHRLHIGMSYIIRTFQKCFSGVLGGFLPVVSAHVIKRGDWGVTTSDDGVEIPDAYGVITLNSV